MQTGFTSWKLAKGLYIIPFLFAYTPLLFEGPVMEVMIVSVAGLVGLFGFTVFWEGYLLRGLNIGERALVVLATVLLFWPDHLYKIAGLVIMLAIYLLQRLGAKEKIPSAQTPAPS